MRQFCVGMCLLVGCSAPAVVELHDTAVSQDAISAVDGGVQADAGMGVLDANQLDGVEGVDGHSPKDADPTGVSERYSLIDNSEWIAVLPDEDMFISPGAVEPDVCPDTEFWSEEIPEGLVFEVNTTFCAHLTVRQALLVDVPAGAVVDIAISHYEIIDGDGGYYLAIAAGEPPSVLWEKTIDVGALESTYNEAFTVPAALTSGEPIVFHISNHGDNHWFLKSLSAEF